MKICKVKNCDRKYHIRGYCIKHNAQIRKWGKLRPELEKGRFTICTIKGCDKKHDSKGYCRRHYQQQYFGKKMTLYCRTDPNKIIEKDDYCEMILCDNNCNERARTIFDKQHLEKVKQYKWSLDSKGYCQSIILKPKRKRLLLHHIVFGYPPEGLMTDHINRNRLDNRDENLRFVTRVENARNSNLNKNNKSGVTGVFRNKRENKWQVSIKCDNKQINLGKYLDINDAIRARKKAELKYWN